jgi:hypothetical protein
MFHVIELNDKPLSELKEIAKKIGFMDSVGVKLLGLLDLSGKIYMSHVHWVVRGTGTPKDRDEVNKREVCECDG